MMSGNSNQNPFGHSASSYGLGSSGGSSGGMGGGLSSIFSGIFGLANNPYQSGMNEYQKYAQQGINAQQPFYNAGQQGMGNYQNWAQQMQDPSQFINNTMNQYQASPYSNYLQNQSMAAGNNAASASGLSGSTPFAQQLQQNAGNISSGDMNQWLGNVLGVNNQYGQSQQNLMNMGQGAANQISNMYGNMGTNMGNGAYNKTQSNNQGWGNLFGGIASMFGL